MVNEHTKRGNQLQVVAGETLYPAKSAVDSGKKFIFYEKHLIRNICFYITIPDLKCQRTWMCH